MPPAPASNIAPLSAGTLKPVSNISVPNENGSILASPTAFTPAFSTNAQGPMTLRQAISIAKNNPTSDFASTLGGFLQKGDADQQAMKEGIDLSFAGRPSLQDMYSEHLEKNNVTMPEGSTLDQLKDGYMGTLESAADNAAKDFQEQGQDVTKNVQESGNEFADANEKGDVPGEVKALSEGVLRSGGDVAKGLWNGAAGIIQAIVDKTSDAKAVEDFAAGNKTTGGILDLYEKLENGLDDIAKQYPDQAKDLGSAANILMSVLGNETEAGDTDIGEAASATAKTAREAAVGPDDGGPPGGAVGAIRDAAGKVVDTIKNNVSSGEMGPQKGIADLIPATGKVADAANAVAGNAGTALKSAYSQVYGLPPDDIDFLIKHPEYATQEALSHASLSNLGTDVETKIAENAKDIPKVDEITDEVKGGLQKKMQAVNEHALEYTKLGNQNKQIKVDPNWLKDQLTNKKIAGVEINPDGQVTHGDADSAIRPSSSPRGAQAMQDLLTTWGPVFADGKMTYKQFLSFRQDLAQLANYKGGVDTVLEKSAHAIRDKFNTTYRKNIPGMDTLDAEHTRLQRDLDNSLTGIATIDKTSGMPSVKMNEGAPSNILNAGKETRGELAKRLENIAPGITNKIAQRNAFIDKWSDLVDQNGKLQGNALGNIKNSLNFTKDLKLQKLEGLMPGISDRLKLIKAAENFHGTLGLKPGKYATGAAISQVLTGNPIVGLAGVALSSPQVGLKILRTLAKYKGQ